ncbi:hypothetical protein GGX14DRAFT_409100 [Mycena pura]|uniref:Uncharacterized protein n=1 Tax=Mycena pura TaxID=153505 RepID=A0AAD6UKC2_9AGAR|nr:hypothetical protein GGX14DRAFT_409100 [Mycena pura]
MPGQRAAQGAAKRVPTAPKIARTPQGMPDSGLPRMQQNGPPQPPKIAKTGCASAEGGYIHHNYPWILPYGHDHLAWLYPICGYVTTLAPLLGHTFKCWLEVMAATKSTKHKEMFKPYNPSDVPDVMPFPEIGLVHSTKNQDTAVPKLNDYQRSWILDAGLRGVDLASMMRKTAAEFDKKVQDDAFEAKAFQHTAQAQDREEEDRIPGLVAQWKRKDTAKPRKVKAAVDDDCDDEGEDKDGRTGLLRGYPKVGWRKAIQKVLSNKRAAKKTKLKQSKPREEQQDGDDNGKQIVDSAALSKLLGLVSYTGHDKFRDDRHDEIYELSKTLPGANASGKFRKAKGLLWANEDPSVWDAAAMSEEDVDWAQHQKLVAGGFKQMVDSLHASRKFRPFVATMLMGWLSDDGNVHFDCRVEGVPKEIDTQEEFRKQNEDFVQKYVDKMHAWADEPLKHYLAARERSARCAQPVFPLGVDDLDDTVAQMVKSFVTESYEAAFGSPDILWADIVSKPNDFYDVARFPLKFVPTGLDKLTLTQMYELASALARGVGPGTQGFFRKRVPGGGDEISASSPPSHHTPSPPPLRPGTPTPSLPPSRPGTPTTSAPPSRPGSPTPSPSPPPPSPSHPGTPPSSPRGRGGRGEKQAASKEQQKNEAGRRNNHRQGTAVPVRETRSTTAKRMAEDNGGGMRKRRRRN